MSDDEKRYGKLVSRLDHPVDISVNGEGCRVSPRAKLENVDRFKLGALPTGVNFIPYTN